MAFQPLPSLIFVVFIFEIGGGGVVAAPPPFGLLLLPASHGGLKCGSESCLALHLGQCPAVSRGVRAFALAHDHAVKMPRRAAHPPGRLRHPRHTRPAMNLRRGLALCALCRNHKHKKAHERTSRKRKCAFWCVFPFVTFAEKLKVLMMQRGDTQESLGEELGIAHTSVGRWLSGAIPRPSTLAILARRFGVSSVVLTDASHQASARRDIHRVHAARADPQHGGRRGQTSPLWETAFSRSCGTVEAGHAEP